MKTYLERYISGEFEQVWNELIQKGDKIQLEPLKSEAIDVATETMKRVRYNIQVLIRNLNTLGYVFGVYPNGRKRVFGYRMPLNSPNRFIDSTLSKLELVKGIEKIPLSLSVFWKVVGDVDFTGYHSSWPPFSDPLVVYPIDTIQAEYSEWLEQLDNFGDEIEPFKISVSPDIFHKDNISGGEPYQVEVPNYGIDFVLKNENHNTTFIDYLRICFRYGGFPGFQQTDKPIPIDLSRLTLDLKPI